MGALIDQNDIGRAVFSLVREGTRSLVSARALAQRLHVSVGALYNYAGSMQGALHAGEHFIETMVREEYGVSDLAQIVELADQERSAAEFLFDPHRLHAEASPWFSNLVAKGLWYDGEAVFDELPSDTKADDLFIEGIRNMVGRLLLDQKQLSVGRVLTQIPASWPRHYAEAIAEARADPQPLIDLTTADVSQDLLDLAMLFIQGANLPDRQLRVRQASLTLLLSEGEAGWKFRSLSNLSGIPLAALHNMGSRDAHLRNTLNDLVVALFRLALRDSNDDLVGAYNRLPYLMVSASDTLLGNFSTVAVPSVIRQLDLLKMREDPEPGSIGVRTLTVTAVYAMLMSAWLRRERDPEGWALAPQIAVNFMDRVRAERYSTADRVLTS